MPASLFKHKPDVSGPEDEVQVAEHLEIIVKHTVSESSFITNEKLHESKKKSLCLCLMSPRL